MATDGQADPRDAWRAAVRRAAEAVAVVAAKSLVERRTVPLGMDLSAYTDADYDAVADYLAPYEEEASRAPQSRSGLRWRHEGKAVLFQHTRVLAAPYEDLVARVDIAGAIRLMDDYIGGASEVVSRDPEGRVTRQAERNLYLPQPNWMALSGGRFIDVCKLEVVHYRDGWQRIAWRTVHSPNGSAVLDDGTVTFERVDDARTRVTVRGLQEFTLPPVWAAAEPLIAPTVRDALVEDSYRRFFTATLDNVEAAYEGRDHRTGRDPVPGEPAWEEQIAGTLAMVRRLLPDHPVQELLRLLRPDEGSVPDGVVDGNGFRHVTPRASGDGMGPDRVGPDGVGPDGVGEPAWAAAYRRWRDELQDVAAHDLGTPR